MRRSRPFCAAGGQHRRRRARDAHAALDLLDQGELLCYAAARDALGFAVGRLGKGDKSGYLNKYYAPDDCLLFKRSNWQAACPEAASHVAPFDAWDYVDHERLFNDSRRGPFGTAYSHWGGRARIWPELALPPSTHGGWLHTRVAARNATPDQPLTQLEAQLSGCDVELPKPRWW